MTKTKRTLPGRSQNDNELKNRDRSAPKTGEGRLEPKGNSKLSRWTVGVMVAIMLVVLGGLVLTTLNSNSAQPQPLASKEITNSPNTIQNDPGSIGALSILVGLPDHQVDIGYPSAAPISLKGSDIPTPDPTEMAQLPISPVMGAFLTTADPAKLENFYSPKLKAAGYNWDSIEICYPDGETRCPNIRAFVADLNNCTNSQTAKASGPCLSTFQIRLWFVGANAGAEEFKVLNMPQSIISQLKPGQTLVLYSASSNIFERPNYNKTTMAVTTAAVAATPTSGLLPTTPIPQSQIFVGPDNAFHVSQYDNNPEKQSTFGASLVTSGKTKPVALGSDGTVQLDWLISEEGMKTTLQATVITPHNAAFTASKLFDLYGFAFLGDPEGRGKISVHLVSSTAVQGAASPNTYVWTMETTPLPPDRHNLSLNFEPASGVVTASPIQFQVKTFAEAGLPHPVNLQPQTPGGQAKGMWLVPQQAYFGSDRTILSLAFQPDVFRDKEAYWLLPQLINPNDLKITDDKGRVFSLLDPSQPLNLSGLVLSPVTAETKKLKLELTNMVVGHNLNQPATLLENAPVTHLTVPVAELLKGKRGQTIAGPTLQTPGIQKLNVEAMSAKLDDSGEYVTLSVRYRATGSLAYPPSLIARSVGFSCEKCAQENTQKPVTSRMLPDGSIDFSLTYKYDPAQLTAELKVDSEQFVLPGPWQFKIEVSH